MKAILQNFKTGELSVEEVPPPQLEPNNVIVLNSASLISAGTEKAIVRLAKFNPLKKAIARPDLVKKVLDKAGQEGLIGTAKIVQNLVSSPLPLGYSSCGVVVQVGENVNNFKPGQRVACAGLGYANHAEVVSVPRNLCVKVPDNVCDTDASFVTVGAIAMQAFRQAKLSLGETVIVFGMGLVGQILAQISEASGCNVICLDIDNEKLSIAANANSSIRTVANLKDAKSKIFAMTDMRGADAVIISAATKSSAPISLAPELLRDRGRVVAVGDVGHNVPRRKFYEKEITLLQSRSYGAGRYDPSYEENGVDYPIGYVRWTENRNMESFIELLANKKIALNHLISKKFKIENAKAAYELLLDENRGSIIGIVLEYDRNKSHNTIISLNNNGKKTIPKKGGVNIGLIGAGQFAQGILLPALCKVSGVKLHSVATKSGLTSLNVAKKYRAKNCSSEARDVLNEASIDAIVIASRHNSHASLVCQSLEAGKHCFVEKPLALNGKELKQVIEAHKKSSSILCVGYNRRFSPYAKLIKDEFSGEKVIMQYRINAGRVAPSSWQHDPQIGGGRIVGEVCHFIDLMQYVTDAKPISVQAVSIDENNATHDSDNLIVNLSFSEGSVGSLLYTSSGHNSFPKERFEVFGGGKVGIIENWRTVKVQKIGGKIVKKSYFKSAKGLEEEAAAFIDGIRNGKAPIDFDDLVLTSKCTFAIQRSLRTGGKVDLE